MPRRTMPVVNLVTNERYDSVSEAAMVLGVRPSTLVNHLRRSSPTHRIKGYIFYYEHLLKKDD